MAWAILNMSYQGFIDTQITGFFLKAQTEGNNYIAFYSSEWPNADQRPKLTVTSS
ncbi:MAG: Disaggregatase related repeat protein [Methanoregulaceae archaeon PtaU1.Bin222]|nr:MAG: Disaggregatase related repeat protein [Methanoregulaceae archaeon PtaU1.Bin222]